MDFTIRAEDLAKVYRSGETELVIFRGLQLFVEQGESLALTGESGAGKSTLLHLLGALDSPSDGAVFYGSTNVTTLDESALAETIETLLLDPARARSLGEAGQKTVRDRYSIETMARQMAELCRNSIKAQN